MPSDYLDYRNNLAFPPKSADDLNEQKRQSDVLISAIEKCEKLEKQLKIAVEALETISKHANDNKGWNVVILKLAKTLSSVALNKIKELNNHG